MQPLSPCVDDAMHAMIAETPRPTTVGQIHTLAETPRPTTVGQIHTLAAVTVQEHCKSSTPVVSSITHT